jgi:hypothetical protein
MEKAVFWKGKAEDFVETKVYLDGSRVSAEGFVETKDYLGASRVLSWRFRGNDELPGC